jgi:hypothetical protein
MTFIEMSLDLAPASQLPEVKVFTREEVKQDIELLFPFALKFLDDLRNNGKYQTVNLDLRNEGRKLLIDVLNIIQDDSIKNHIITSIGDNYFNNQYMNIFKKIIANFILLVFGVVTFKGVIVEIDIDSYPSDISLKQMIQEC